MSTIDEIRMTLNGRDIEIFIERFLGALNDINGGGDVSTHSAQFGSY